MADIPTPRSYNQILGDMAAAFLARYPVKNLKVGGPILSIMESAAQSDLRNTSDIFKFLASTNLDSAEGDALAKTLKDEGTEQLGSVAATGLVTIGDSRYTKLSSTVYHGKPAPIIGSSTLYVSDVTSWPNSGTVYIGRNTANYEGPLTYTAIVNFGSYAALTLSPSTKTNRFHNLGESVIVGQGGDRTISAGTTVSVAQGNVSTPTTYSVLYSVILPDGEVSLEGIQVVCTQPGTLGNAPLGAISQFVSAPFTGATVTNPLPFTNGFDAESEEQARARVRKLRAAKAKGTSTAIAAYLDGVVAQDESKRITSVSVIDREGLPAVAYIDDGTGYEEVSAGVAYEVLTSSAVGGEQYFQLSLGRPIAKAHIETSSIEPWDMSNVQVLSALVGGIQYQHQFGASDFRSPTSAAAFEITHSINADSSIAFSARLSDSGRRVTLFAKDDSNEDLQVVSPTSGIDANTVLGFPSGEVDTCKLFKNDILLSKDGRAATFTGNPQSTWQAIVSGDTITVNVDGTGNIAYTILDLDFVNANTGYLSVSGNNSLAAWAAVFNAKIPGITASVVGNALQLVSNSGAVSRGSIAIVSGTLVTKSMFSPGTALARTRDYTLNRNTGQLRLAVPLVTGDSLSVGSPNTNAFLESSFLGGTVTLAGGNMYFVVDSQTQKISLPIVNSTTFTEAADSFGGGPNQTDLASSSGSIFANVQLGDWVVMTDAALQHHGAFRVSRWTDANTITIATGDLVSGGPVSLANGGLTVARTTANIQKVVIAAGQYTAESLASAITAQLEGAHVEIVRTGHFRVVADTRNGGDVMYIAGDPGVAGIPLATGVLAVANVSNNAFLEAGNPENDVPRFNENPVLVSSTLGTTTSLVLANDSTRFVSAGDLVTGLRSIVYDGTHAGYGNPLGYVSALSSYVVGASSTLTLREALPNPWLVKDRAYVSRPYCIGPKDDLSIVLDGDTDTKAFTIPMGRRVLGVASNYSSSGMTLKDADNGAASFGQAFGSTFSFNDFALYMHPREITGVGGNNAILWRWNDMGPSGAGIAIDFTYPRTPATAQTWAVSTISSGISPNYNSFQVVLASGAARSLPNQTTTMRVGRVDAGAIGSVSKSFFILALKITGYAIVDHVTYSTVNLTLDMPAASIGSLTNHNLVIGNILWPNYSGVPLANTAFTMTAVPDGTHISYNVSPAVAVTSGSGNLGYLYFDSPGGVSLDWSSVVASDVLNFTTGVWGTTIYDTQPLFINQIVPSSNNAAIEVWIPQAGIASSAGAVSWTANAVAGGLTVAPVGGTTGSIVTAIDATWPVTAIASAPTLGSVTQSTWVVNQSMTIHPSVFSDGINYIKTTYPATAPTDFTFDLKDAVSANLLNNANWNTEEAYLVPLTADNLVSFLNTMAVSGIGQSSSIKATSRGEKIQITSNTQGSLGSVQVLGGLANDAKADVIGNAAPTSDNAGCYVTVAAAQMAGFHGSWMCEIDNILGDIKSNAVSTANLTSVVGNTWTFSASLGQYDLKSNINWQFERQGRYMVAVWNGLGTDPAPAFTYPAGSYFFIQSAGGDTVSPSNCGLFTIIAIDSAKHTIWYENSSGVEERSIASVSFATRDSLVPGDTINVNTLNWGNNQRTFTVSGITMAGSPTTFSTVETPNTVPTPVAGPQPQVSVRAGTPLKLVKKITSILPYASNSTLNTVVFGKSIDNNSRISSIYGSTLKAMSKLEFPSTLAIGKDGYAYNTGLIGEANRVLYGVESDKVTYPGVVASGASVNISGPVVRRIQISLGLRLRNGANKQATFDAARSAVATYINGLGVGIPVAISNLVNAAGAVGGVDAVSVSSPTYSTTSDQIPVQPYEKPMVLQPDLDITLTLIG
jgi:Baseplate J-like protein